MCVLTSTPGLCRGLVTSLLAHGIWLTFVLGHSGVNGLNDIRSDGGKEDLYNLNQLNSASVQLLPDLSSTGGFEAVVPLVEGGSHRWQSHRRTGW
jgi:hypothetical protein